RLPVHAPEETAAIVRKTLAHAAREKPQALLVHADGWIDARDSARAMAASLAARGFEVEPLIYGDDARPPTPERTLARLAGGADVALHLGHGSEQGWHGCLGPAERDALCAAPACVFL